MALFPEDKPAAILGAIATLALLFVLSFAINRLTVAAHSEHETPAAGESSH